MPVLRDPNKVIDIKIDCWDVLAIEKTGFILAWSILIE
jgi:hypothetical protein